MTFLAQKGKENSSSLEQNEYNAFISSSDFVMFLFHTQSIKLVNHEETVQRDCKCASIAQYKPTSASTSPRVDWRNPIININVVGFRLQEKVPLNMDVTLPQGIGLTFLYAVALH